MGWNNYGVTIYNGQNVIINLGKEDIPAEILLHGPDAWIDYCKEKRTPAADIYWVLYSEYGSIITDYDKKYLLFFGGSDLSNDIFLRRRYLHLVGTIWEDWTITWASNGYVDIAHYLRPDYQVETDCFQLSLKIERLSKKSMQALFSSANRENVLCPDIIVTVQTDKGVRIYSSDSCCYDEVLLTGECLYEYAAEISWNEQLVFDASQMDFHGMTFPGLGIHIVPERKELYYWISNPFEVQSWWVRMCWPGWIVHYWGDNYEEHLKFAEGRIHFKPNSEAYYSDILEKYLHGR